MWQFAGPDQSAAASLASFSVYAAGSVSAKLPALGVGGLVAQPARVSAASSAKVASARMFTSPFES